MAVKVGRNATLALSDTDSSYTVIGKIKSVSISGTHDEADATTNDSAGFKEQEYADSQYSIEVEFLYDQSDTGQEELRTAFNSKAKKYFQFRPEAGGGEDQWVFQGTIADLNLNTETGSIESSSCTINSTGTVTKSTQ